MRNFWESSSAVVKVLMVVGLIAAALLVIWLLIALFGGRGSSGPEKLPTPTATATSQGGDIIVVVPTQTIPTPAPGVPTVVANTTVNVRSGPGTEYSAIGLLVQGQMAEAVGVNSEGTWYAITYPNPPDNQGWVAAEFVTVNGGEGLPVLPAPPLPAPTPTPPLAITDWRGEYFANRDLQGDPVLVRNDAAIAFDWGQGSPGQGVPNDGFSARWTISRNMPAGTLRFSAWVDDGVRIWVDNDLVIDQWQDGPPRNFVVDVKIGAGAHNARVEYYDATGHALIYVDIGYVADTPPGQPQPPIAVISGPSQAVAGQEVTFDASGSTVAEGSRIATSNWEFGDGANASGIQVRHTYAAAGQYTVSLALTDDQGLSSTATQQITVVEPEATLVPPETPEAPVAVINAPSQGNAGETIRFDAGGSTSSGNIVSYAWTFGDGTAADGVNVDKIYVEAGLYDVTLVVSDDTGQQAGATHSIEIVAAEAPTPTSTPEAGLPLPPISSQSWQLTALSDGQGGLVPVLAGTELTAIFAVDGTLTGTAGCNTFNGTYVASPENELAVGALAIGRLICGDPAGIMEQESAYLSALGAAASFAVQGTGLSIAGADGQVLLTYAGAGP